MSGIQAIADVLRSGMTAMDTITLDGSDGGFPLPVKQLKGTDPVEALDFSNKGLGLASAFVIAKLISINTGITNLDLSENKISKKGAIAIAESLNTAGLNRLDLRYNDQGVRYNDQGILGDAEKQAVRDAVKEATSLADARRKEAVAEAVAAVQKEAELVRTKAVEKTAKQVADHWTELHAVRWHC